MKDEIKYKFTAKSYVLNSMQTVKRAGINYRFSSTLQFDAGTNGDNLTQYLIFLDVLGALI